MKVFEYKNSHLSVVEGAPEKPQFATYVKSNPHYKSANEQFTAALEFYKEALASCRRIPVADEDQIEVKRMLYQKSKTVCSFKWFEENELKEGELYHVDVEVEIVRAAMSLDTGSTNRFVFVARIKQPETSSAHSFTEGSEPFGPIDDSLKGIDKLPVVPSLNAEQEKPKFEETLLTITDVGLQTMLVDFALAYHKSNHKDIGNDSSEFINDNIEKYQVKPVVASTEDQPKNQEELFEEYRDNFNLKELQSGEKLALSWIYKTFTLTRNPKQP